ncbi:MAG: hypothetical protein JWQ35_1788 [Bacteriovoracaceae bacterium]|nr:hypothetical protein [Bacteriovoracaceae bacterium]
MQWPSLHEVSKKLAIPTGYSISEIAEFDISNLIENLKNWVPYLTVGSESEHLEANFYRDSVCLLDSSRDRDHYGILIKFNGELVGFCTFKKCSRSLTVESGLSAVSSKHRGHNLGNLIFEFWHEVSKLMHAETMIGIGTLQSIQAQLLAEKWNFKLVGIIPGYDIGLNRQGERKRVYEAFYIKHLVPDSALELPSSENLTAQTKKLFEVLFGQPFS